MKVRQFRWTVFAGLLLASGLAFAIEPVAANLAEEWDARMTAAKEKQHRAAAMRAEETRRFEAEQKDCYKKFRVIDCQRDSRMRHNQVVRQARVLENEGQSEERLVRKERRTDKDARQAVENKKRAAELPGKEAAVARERQRDEAERTAKLSKKEKQKAEGVRRRARDAERIRNKQEAHERKVQKQMEKAARREAQKAPQNLQ